MGCLKLKVLENQFTPLKVVYKNVDAQKKNRTGNIRYTYNGKEFLDDLGVNWHYYGARMYDPAIARFTGVDPIAEDFAHLSTYNYADNSPIANIDLHGLQALYAADGKLLGYSVQENQGPTQIAEDLKENYSCQLSCEADWTQIVYDNGGEFQNVFDGDGNVTDKFNEDFESGNIQPGTILEITNGKEIEPEVSSIENSGTPELDRKIDSFSHEITESHKRMENYNGINDFSRKYEKSSREGVGTGAANSMSAARNETDSVNNVRKRDALIQKRDSINQSNKK